MKRSLALVALWLLTAILAVTIAWKGVSVVGDQVTSERPAPLAASEIERRLDEAGATATTTIVTPTTASPGASSTSTTAPTTTTTATNSPPATVGTTSAPGPTTAPPPPAAPPAATSETRTYSLVGGTASLRFSSAGVEVVFANPAAGFTVEVEPENVNGVKVEFESDSHKSRVDGWWDGGPVDRVREDPES